MRAWPNDKKFWVARWLPFWGPVMPAPEIQKSPVRQSASALPRNIQRLMDAKDLKVGQLSKASGVNRSTIRNVLKTGKAHNHTLDVVLRLAEALGVTLNELVEERES